MKTYEFGNPEADIILIQLVDEHDLKAIEKETLAIATYTDMPFRLVAIEINSWNEDLSPWKVPAVFGNEGFGDGASKTLEEVLKLCADKSKTYYIGGYSLAGLFALWVAYQTDVFSGVAAASPSMWFPDFIDYMKNHEIHVDKVYLSLGNKEEKTKNTTVSTVGNRIKEAQDFLTKSGIESFLEWNEGNHFRDMDIRTAKAFAWVMANNNT
ncbi:MAG: esterase [Lachnospiraceae bacterium]|nr:esterase [Lachnospiraceae bacterium]